MQKLVFCLLYSETLKGTFYNENVLARMSKSWGKAGGSKCLTEVTGNKDKTFISNLA